MKAPFHCGRQAIELELPDSAVLYASHFPAPSGEAAELVDRAVAVPVAGPALGEAIARRRAGDVVIVVSDVTRPIPYAAFLPGLLGRIEAAGVQPEEITILIATGMHRPSTPAERVEMFGRDVVGRFRIEDHNGESPDLVELPAPAWSGHRVRLNRRFVQAGFRLITGLVEPHFMAGSSGGRKAVCPGLAALETVRRFHGQAFLADPRARNGRLEGNPLHAEALSVARQAGVDFSLNVVLNGRKQVVAAFAGSLEPAHEEACRFVRQCACPRVERPADVAITSSGGYPLDATFYQCVKGFVSALPAVRPGGTVLAFGGCSEGIGSPEYRATMARYAGDWRAFLRDIRDEGMFVKDQWQFQMHCRALERVGVAGLHFLTPGLDAATLSALNVSPHPVAPDQVAAELARLMRAAVAGGASLAVFPEGPYCAPVAGDDSAG